VTTTAYAWAPITKVEDQPDGTVMVYGPMTDAGIDRDRQGMNQDWLDKAVPAWMKEAGNVREQHQSTRAVGVGVQLDRRPDGVYDLGAHVVDPVAVAKVKAGVLKGYSVGIKDPQINLGKAEFPNGEIVGGSIVEVSLVDRPANPRTMFTMVKVDGAGELAEVDGPTVEETEGAPVEDEQVEKADAAQAVSDNDEDETEETEEDQDDEDEDEDVTKAEIAAMFAAHLQEVKALVAGNATVTKADAPATVDNSPTADIVKAAVAEATKPLIDELTLVKADLAKALAMPQAGGPVAMRTASQTQAARETDAAAMRAEAQALLLKADDATHDLTLRQGYRDRARDLLLKAEAAPLR